ncbi:adenine phosphoribosyltransferase [bacterium]|nr:adenine phosphoribosyltransferase [bacterium]
MNFKKYIRDIPDFPEPGIIFKDITPLLQNAEAFVSLNNLLYDRYKEKKIDVIAGIDARGFIFGSVLAYKLGVGFVPVRKKGKLPYKTVSCDFKKEYGDIDTLEIHEDAIKKGDNVLLIDDLLATGGTAGAVANMIKGLGANLVEVSFIIELAFLKGRDKLKGFDVFSVVEY